MLKKEEKKSTVYTESLLMQFIYIHQEESTSGEQYRFSNCYTRMRLRE